jgi:hypothetical protein
MSERRRIYNFASGVLIKKKKRHNLRKMSLKDRSKELTKENPIWIKLEGNMVKLKIWWIEEILYDEHGHIRWLDMASDENCEGNNINRGQEYVQDIIRENFKSLTNVFEGLGISEHRYKNTTWWKSARYLYYYNKRRDAEIVKVIGEYGSKSINDGRLEEATAWIPDIKLDIVEDVDIKIRDAMEDFGLEFTDQEDDETTGTPEERSRHGFERGLMDEPDDPRSNTEVQRAAASVPSIAEGVARRQQPKQLVHLKKVSTIPARRRMVRRVVVRKEDLDKKLPAKRKK